MALLLLVLLLVAAGVAFYRFGKARGSWTQWRASVGVLRSRRREAFRSVGGLALLAAGVALVLFLVFSLSAHH